MKNKLRPGKGVQCALADVGASEAIKMGQSFAVKLKARKSAVAGVDQFRLAYPAIHELGSKQPWFLPFMTVIGQRLLEKAIWGMFVRVFLGCSLALLDVFSDIYMVSDRKCDRKCKERRKKRLIKPLHKSSTISRMARRDLRFQFCA